ncbi:MAG: PilC/PilY family type IV pilus protein [Halioglobus sp.]
MRFFATVTLSLIFLLSLSAQSRAEDIDLFLGLPGGGSVPPNVLFIIDNTSNWSQAGDEEIDGEDAIFYIQKAALQQVIRELPENVVNVGLMMFTETGNPNSNIDGGYVRGAIRLMTPANKILYENMIGELEINRDQANGDAASLVMAEAYTYFDGKNPIGGNRKEKADFDANNYFKGEADDGGDTDLQEVFNLTDGRDVFSGFSGFPYNKPDDTCKNYIIWISNGAVNENTPSKRDSRTYLDTIDTNGDYGPIPLTGDFPWDARSDNPSDEWARYMEDNLQLSTFTIDINRDERTNSGKEWTATLQSMANSELRYFATNATVDEIVKSIKGALTQILAEDSVFASVALPASANTQSTFLNQVFIGQFRPDPQVRPRWDGNLKQYKLDFIGNADGTQTLRLVDSTGASAVDSGPNGSGFLNECSRSFWGPDTDTYWSFLSTSEARGACQTAANYKESNAPDGPVVEKGGQAYVLRGGSSFSNFNASGRAVLTASDELCGPTSAGLTPCIATDTFALTAVNDPNSMGVGSTSELSELISWLVGVDTENEDEDADGNVTDVRPSVHGDVIHSQPIAINYSSDPTTPGVVVFYGGNDGVLRAVNGNREDPYEGVDEGSEFWAFMPPEFYDQAARLKSNDPNDPNDVVRFPASGLSVGSVGQPKPYGPDGPITAYQDGSTKWLFVGMRRGGRTIYSLDVSNLAAPQVRWRLGCDDAGCATGWENLGQTWSPMNLAFSADAGRTKPYVIMGGGYDTCDDDDNGDPNSPINHTCSSTPGSGLGNGVYIIDAETGELVQTLETDRAVPGAITIVPVSDNDNNISWAYAADMGGNVYRISGADANTAIGTRLPGDPTVSGTGWTISKIASLGCSSKASPSSCDANRKFMFGPDVARIQDNKFAVLVGSGEREKPLEAYEAAGAVQNYFFGMTDIADDADWLDNDPSGSKCGSDTLCMDSFTTLELKGALVDGAQVGTETDNAIISDKGWKFRLLAGEQVVSGALTVSDDVNFSTHIPVDPSLAACDSDLGTATTYNIGFDDGVGKANNINSGGLVPTPVAGKVILDDGTTVPFCIGCGGENSAIGGSEVTSSVNWSQPKSRVYYKVEI